MSRSRRAASRCRRGDLFALGVVLWELLTGKRMFAGDSDAETSTA